MKKNLITALKIDSLALLITLGICLAVALIVGLIPPASANAPASPDPAPSIIEDTTTVTIIGTDAPVELTREDLVVPIAPAEPAPMPIDNGEPALPPTPIEVPAPGDDEPIGIGGAMLLDYCAIEDDVGPCFWDANVQGNGIGHSFVRIDNFTYYLPGS